MGYIFIRLPSYTDKHHVLQFYIAYIWASENKYFNKQEVKHMRQQETYQEGCSFDWLEPVSYTHLDVYKRQELANPKSGA